MEIFCNICDKNLLLGKVELKKDKNNWWGAWADICCPHGHIIATVSNEIEGSLIFKPVGKLEILEAQIKTLVDCTCAKTRGFIYGSCRGCLNLKEIEEEE